MFDFFRGKHGLGMSIGDRMIRLAGIERKADQIKLTGLAAVPLEEGWIVKGTVQDMKAASAAVRDQLSDLKLGGAKVHLSVSVGKCFMRRLTLHAGSDEQLRSQIDVEINSWQFLPFKSFVFDYISLQDAEEAAADRKLRKFGLGRPKNQTVLVFVTSAEMVEQQVALIKLAGLKPASVELAPLALNRTLVYLHNRGTWGSDGRYAMLHVEEEEMILSIFEQGVPVLMHPMTIHAGESPLELETYYQNHTAQMLSAEITRMLSYGQSGLEQRSDQECRLYLSGDLKRVQTMAGYLEKSYSGEILTHPFHLLFAQETETPYDFAVPVGLAMKGA